jgi:hypothetical protein
MSYRPFHLLPTLCLLSLLAGCASTDYSAYIRAQQYAHDKALAAQKPLVKIIAQPGQSITGLQSIEIYTPAPAPVIAQSRPSEWAGVLNTALGVAGTVLGIREAGRAASSLADSVGRSSTAGYPYVQAPQTIGGNGVIGNGTYQTRDATHAPIVVEQPPPVIVTQPDPVVLTQPEPIVVTQPAPTIVDPVIVTQPAPTIVDPMIVQ